VAHGRADRGGQAPARCRSSGCGRDRGWRRTGRGRHASAPLPPAYGHQARRISDPLRLSRDTTKRGGLSVRLRAPCIVVRLTELGR
jgi:hypothetical protein